MAVFQLVVMDGVDRGKTAEVGEGTSFLGRSLRNQVPLKDGSVSNRHLKVVRIGRKIFVEDLRSTNGTRVNGRRLDPGQSVEVAVGDLIRLGRTLIRIDPLPEKGGEFADTARGGRVRGATVTAGDIQDRRQASKNGTGLIREVSELMKESMGLHGFYKKVLEQILDDLPRVDLAALVYLDPLKPKLKNKTLILQSRPELGLQEGRLVSEKVIDRVLENGRPVRMVNKDCRETGETVGRNGKASIRSVLCLPLISNATLRGVLYVHSMSSSCGFRSEDFLTLDTLSTLLALALENALAEIPFHQPS
jgi:GAF domain-containing protein